MAKGGTKSGDKPVANINFGKSTKGKGTKTNGSKGGKK